MNQYKIEVSEKFVMITHIPTGLKRTEKIYSSVEQTQKTCQARLDNAVKQLCKRQKNNA